MIERSGRMTLATTIALPVVRGPVALAKALMAIDLLSGGRCLAGVGPGSSERDYAAAGVPFAERWPRFDDALAVLREELPGIPVWVASWGSRAGLARVARRLSERGGHDVDRRVDSRVNTLPVWRTACLSATGRG